MMKKTALLMLTLLGGMVFWPSIDLPAGKLGKTLSLGRVRAWAAPPQAAEEKKPQWKSREEYDAYQAMATERDPNKKISLAEAFLQKFGNTDFKDLTYLEVMKAYQQLRDGTKAIESGHKALEANPDNLDSLTLVGYVFPFAFKGDDPEATAKLSRAESVAKHGLEVLQKAQKPASLSDEQFSQSVRARRAIFNSLVGFVALQRKDYPAAISSFKIAGEDNPSDVYTFYRLGVAYVSAEPRDYDNAVWNLARSVALARAAQNAAAAEAAAEIEKYLTRLYVNYHGNEEGLAGIIAQAAASPTPPEGFKVTAMETPKPTGNASIDAFNQTFFPLKVGGERAQKLWDSLKGQPFGVGGFVDGVERGAEPGVYLVRIDVLDQSKAADGVYDVELRDSTQPNVKNLSKGDPVRFEGSIQSYTVTPNFVLTLGGTINADDIPDQPRVAPKPKPRPRATPTRRTTRRPPR